MGRPKKRARHEITSPRKKKRASKGKGNDDQTSTKERNQGSKRKRNKENSDGDGCKRMKTNEVIYKTVKMKASQFFKNVWLCDELGAVAKSLTCVEVQASRLINTAIADALESRESREEKREALSVLQENPQTFVYRAMTVCRNGYISNDVFEEQQPLYDSLQKVSQEFRGVWERIGGPPQFEDLKGVSNMINYAARRYTMACSKHVSRNFRIRLAAYFRSFLQSAAIPASQTHSPANPVSRQRATEQSAALVGKKRRRRRRRRCRCRSCQEKSGQKRTTSGKGHRPRFRHRRERGKRFYYTPARKEEEGAKLEGNSNRNFISRSKFRSLATRISWFIWHYDPNKPKDIGEAWAKQNGQRDRFLWFRKNPVLVQAVKSEISSMIDGYKDIFPIAQTLSLTAKSAWPKFLPWLAEMRARQGDEERCYSLLPLSSFDHIHYVTVDLVSLHSLGRRMEKAVAGYKRPLSEKKSGHNACASYEGYCNLQKLNMSAKWSLQSVQTDGCGVSATLCRTVAGKSKCDASSKKAVPNEEDAEDEPDIIQQAMDVRNNTVEDLRGWRVVGVDPGRRSLVTCYTEHRSSGVSTRQISTPSYRSSCMTSQAMQRRKLWMRKCKLSSPPDHSPTGEKVSLLDYMTKLPSGKTFSSEQLIGHATALFLVLRQLLDIAASNKVKNLRFRQECRRRREIDRVCKEILLSGFEHEDVYPLDRGIAVAFGKPTFSSTSAGNAPAPCRGVRDALHRMSKNPQGVSLWKGGPTVKIRVLDVYEFRTSKLCSQCYEPMEGLKTSDRLHRYEVRHCSALHCPMSYWNRDINAARNIWLLGKIGAYDRPGLVGSDPRRPKEFRPPWWSS
eukprot:Rmarinus@m.11374